MSDNTISKKELLEITGITYGQLYRWKRKNLIPEEWFIKRSSFTGQETYFPKDKILERVEKILNLKEDRSLDELADTFSPIAADIKRDRSALFAEGYFKQEVFELYETQFGEVLEFSDLLGLLICQEHLLAGSISTEEGSKLIQLIQKRFDSLPEKVFELLYLRKLGTGFWVLLEAGAVMLTDEDTKQVLTIKLQTYVEKIKTQLGN